MHVLLFKKSSLSGCYKSRHVTNREVLLFINSKFLDFESAVYNMGPFFAPYFFKSDWFTSVSAGTTLEGEAQGTLAGIWGLRKESRKRNRHSINYSPPQNQNSNVVPVLCLDFNSSFAWHVTN